MHDHVKRFNAPRVGWLMVFFVVLTWVSPAMSGIDRVKAEPVFSLDVRDMPLQMAFGRIGAMTGYTIDVPDAWADERVTVHFVDVSLSDGLGRMLSGYNYFLLTDDDARQVAVRILGRCAPLDSLDSSKSPVYTTRQSHASSVSGSVLVIGGGEAPSIEGGVRPTEQETRQSWGSGVFDPDDIEVVPPQGDGLRAPTPREIAVREEATPAMDVSQLDLVPPGHDGE